MVETGNLLFFFIGFLCLVAVLTLGAWIRSRNSDQAERIANQVLGMTKQRALQHIRQKEQPHRIIQEDDQTFIVGGDEKPNRINLIIRDGRVINYKLG